MQKIVAVLLICCVAMTIADVPVHCLYNQVTGQWKLSLSKTQENKIKVCGEFEPDQVVQVELARPNIVKDASGKQVGTFTIVNDEGAEITLNSGLKGQKSPVTMFHYFQWQPKAGVETQSKLGIFNKEGELLKKEQTISHCHLSHKYLATFHDAENANWGCYHAEKLGKITSADDYVVDSTPEQETMLSGENEADDVHDSSAEDDLLDEEYEFGDEAADEIEDMEDEAAGEVQFKNSERFVQLLNKAQNSWTATQYPEWEMYTVAELRKMAGSDIKDPNTYGKQVEMLKEQASNNAEEVSDSDDDNVPAEWDWSNVNGVNYLGDVKQQSSCGGCYTFATMSALEARARIATKNQVKPTLSVQQALSCNPYAQGCDGGFSFLVGKFAKDYHLVDAKCAPYKAHTGKCDAVCSNPALKLKVKQHRFVGGFFGGSNEKNMMKEIYKNGPITAGFKVHSDLMHYRTGVYSHVDFNNVMGVDDADVDVHPWEPTSHTIAIVGYGVENGQKYWKIQNSWGKNFGDDGFFKIKRGTDECNIESAPVAFDIDMEKSKLQ